jgi:hypothetical protein
MLDMVNVVALKPLGDYRLHVRFSDNSEGVFDFADFVAQEGQMVQPLRDPALFAKVYISYGALTWPTGFDICPDWLRMEMEAANLLSVPSAA